MQHPYLWILKADVEKYTHTTSALVVVLLKAAESVLALLWSFRLTGLLRRLILSLFGGKAFTPLLPDPRLARFVSLTGTGVERCLLTALLLCCLLILLSLTAEGAVLVCMRFASFGARTARIVLRILCLSFLALIVLLSALAVCIAFSGDGFQPAVLIAAAACIAPLTLVYAYYRDTVPVMDAIEYELRLGFKETEMAETKLERDSFLLGLLSGAAAAAVWRLHTRGWLRLRSPLSWIVLLTLLAVRYFAVYGSFRVFRRCHR